MNMYHYTECGLDYIFLKNGHTKVETAYGSAMGITDVEGLHRAIGLRLVKSKPELNGAEQRFLRKFMDMSQQHLAHLNAVDSSTVRNWETGRRDAPASAVNILRVLFLEYAEKEGGVRELVERLADLNREEHHYSMEFENSGEEWRQAA